MKKILNLKNLLLVLSSVALMACNPIGTSKVEENKTESIFIPLSPSGLNLIAPVGPTGFSATPTIRVSGVNTGHTIKIFSDNICATQVASGIATGTTIDLTTTSLAAGSYNFYANATNLSFSTSACSIASISYMKICCPSNYILVESRIAAGTTNDFCVMQFEAKSVAGVPTSQPALASRTLINAA